MKPHEYVPTQEDLELCAKLLDADVPPLKANNAWYLGRDGRFDGTKSVPCWLFRYDKKYPGGGVNLDAESIFRIVMHKWADPED